jgi:pSer/pThr/pTyr-binding forkhead associated (FHA) protein
MAVRIVVRPRAGGASAAGAAPVAEPVTYALEQTRVVIGRGAGADVRLPSAAVSETHVVLRATGSTWVAVDEGSTNGTRVDGQRLAPGRPKALRSGDVLRLPGFDVEVQLHVATAVPTSAEATAALARRLVREALALSGTTADPPRLVVVGGADAGKELVLPPPPARLLIGRGEHCDLRLQDADASREHVEIACDLDGVVARDLGSKNGLVVGGRAVRERRLRDRDELLVGSTPIVFEDPAEQAVRALEGVPDEPVEDGGDGDAPSAKASGAALDGGGEVGCAHTGSAPSATVATGAEARVPSAGLGPDTANSRGIDVASSESGSADPTQAGRPPADGAAAAGRSPADSAAAGGSAAGRAPPGAASRPGRASGSGVDALVYALAVAVLAASGVALYWLLRSG